MTTAVADWGGAPVGTRTVVAARLAIVAAVLVIWELAARYLVSPNVIGQPLEIAQRFWRGMADGTLLYHAGVTASEMLLGLLLGVVTGIAVGLILGLIPALGEMFEPYLVAVYSLPKIALAPLMILWLGIGFQSKLFYVWLISFFFIFFSVFTGLNRAPQLLIEQVRLMGAKQRHIVWKILLPYSMVWVFSGLRIAVPYSLLAALAAEIIASTKGVGYLILRASQAGNMNGILTPLILVVFLSVIVDQLSTSIERRALRWRRTQE